MSWFCAFHSSSILLLICPLLSTWVFFGFGSPFPTGIELTNTILQPLYQLVLRGEKDIRKLSLKLLIRTWSCCQLLYSVLCSFWLRCIPWTGLITWCRTTCYTGTYLLVLSPGVKWLQVFSSLKLQVGLLCEVLYCTCVVLLSHCCGLGRYQIVEGVLEELGLQHEHRAIGLFFILFRLRNVGLEQDIREVV